MNIRNLVSRKPTKTQSHVEFLEDKIELQKEALDYLHEECASLHQERQEREDQNKNLKEKIIRLAETNTSLRNALFTLGIQYVSQNVIIHAFEKQNHLMKKENNTLNESLNFVEETFWNQNQWNSNESSKANQCTSPLSSQSKSERFKNVEFSPVAQSRTKRIRLFLKKLKTSNRRIHPN